MNYEDKTTYKGYTIEATLDQCPENPLLDWDHGTTLVTDDNHLFYNTDQQTGLPAVPDLTKDQARSLIPDLMREAGYTSTKQWLLDNYFLH